MMHEILIEALGYKESRICKEEARNDFEMYESARCMVTSKFASTRRERATRPGLLSSCEGANQTKTRPPDVHAGGLFDSTLRKIRKGR
jgi:hypothetical protein